MKILAVDDEPDMEALISQRFRKQIKENKFEFVFARNGNEALEKLEKDYNMKHITVFDSLVYHIQEGEKDE